MVNVNQRKDPAVYALHAGDFHFRYVGATTKNSQNRLYEHIYRARAGHTGPVYQWMREVGIRNVRVVDIEKITDLAAMGQREAQWIVTLLSSGHDLVNRLSRDGRVGSIAEESKPLMGAPRRGKPTWITGKHGAEAGWTDERRQRQSDRMKKRRAQERLAKSI